MIIVDGEFEFGSREEFVDWLVKLIEDNHIEKNVRNILPAYSVRKNCEHHPIRIAREIGFKVDLVKRGN